MMADLMARYGGANLALEYDPLDDPDYGKKTKLKKKKRTKNKRVKAAKKRNAN
jgi:hypothetical protein